jgi:hypothetical protein
MADRGSSCFDIVENAGPVFKARTRTTRFSRQGHIKAVLDLVLGNYSPRVFNGLFDLGPKPGVVDGGVHGQADGKAAFAEG